MLARQPPTTSAPPSMAIGDRDSPRRTAAKAAAKTGSVATMTDESAAGSLPSARVCSQTVSAVEAKHGASVQAEMIACFGADPRLKMPFEDFSRKLQDLASAQLRLDEEPR